MQTYEEASGDGIAALADPTRRAVFERLQDGPRSVGEIAAELPVSRPAVSQHLRVLKEAGLVVAEPEGNRRIYRLEPTGLAELHRYVERFWDVALERFKDRVEAKEENR